MARKKNIKAEKEEPKDEAKKGETKPAEKLENKEPEEKAGEKKEEPEEKVEEIEEFSLDKITEEKEISEVFEEEEVKKGEIEEAEAVPREEEIVEERIYTIPLAKARVGPRGKWAKKSIRFLREFMTRHFKPENLVISQEVNEKIWEHGIEKPPRRLKVRATKNADGLVVVYLA